MGEASQRIIYVASEFKGEVHQLKRGEERKKKRRP
jgi:hypothetical protein